MFKSEDITLDKINQFLYLHDILSPALFDKDENLRKEAEKTLLSICEFLTNYINRTFQNITIEDYLISGPHCYYNYNTTSSLELIILISPNLKIISKEEFNKQFKNINFGLIFRGYDFYISGIKVAYSWQTDMPQNAGIYSLKTKQWLKKALLSPYPFTPEEFQKCVFAYNQKIEDFLSSLKRDDDNILTMESADNLIQFSTKLQEESLIPSSSDIQEHEINYNLYRYAKQLNLPQKLISMATEAYGLNLSK